MNVEITVRFGSGTYTTSTVNRLRASSTMDAHAAAVRFGERYFGPAFIHVRELPPIRGDHNTHRYLVRGDDMETAYCWQSGRIDIGMVVPDGAIAIAIGPRRALEERLSVLARHGQGASTGLLLVPGVPEADEGDAKVDALAAWTDWCAQGNGGASRHQVRFVEKRKPPQRRGKSKSKEACHARSTSP